MKGLHLKILVSLLILTGLSCFLYKALVLKFPLSADTKSYLWNVEMRVSFEAQGKSARVSVHLPRSSQMVSVMDENFISLGYGLTMTNEGTNRKATWSVRKTKGRQDLFYRAVIRYAAASHDPLSAKNFELQEHGLEGARLAAAQALLDEVKQKTVDREELTVALLAKLAESQTSENVRILTGRKPSEQKRLETAVKILALDRIGARLVHGIRLEEKHRDSPIIHWLEVVSDNGKEWVSFEPSAGKAGLSTNSIAWWRGPFPLAEAEGGERLVARISVDRNIESGIKNMITSGEMTHPWIFEYSLFSLPLETQAVYSVILLIPVGALFVVFLRNVIGIKTFGTFMPVLIAVAFRETQLLWGLIFLGLLIGTGLIVRFYLARLRLLMVPRLAAVLCVVVLIMAAVSILTHKWGIERGLSLALFPMVIMTMMIERMTIVWEEQGPPEAMRQGAGSLFAASLTYLLLTARPLQHLIFVFPELLLIVLACNLLLGRYTGYRVTELFRFGNFSGETKT